MRLASMKPNDLAVVANEHLVPIGDLLTTGNPDSPAFQKQLTPGDTLKAEIEGIGAMNLSVTRAD